MMLTKQQQSSKRFFDICFVLILVPIIIIPLIFLYILASISTKANGWFVQQRVGMHGKLFPLYKLRSLKGTLHRDVSEINKSQTLFGSWLRKTKLDELPQVFNVLKGEMSLVGPRPDIPGYADQLQGEDRLVLSVKPGITGPATLKYKNEDAILLQQKNPLQYNDEVIWPDKVEINKEYIKNWSLTKDIGYLWASIFN